MPTPSTRVLVADDNADVTAILQALLATEAGLECVGGVSDGAEVGAALLRLKPDVLLLDLELNGISGIDILRSCRRDHPGVVVMILSGHSAPALIREARDAGAADYLVKPDDLDQLGARIRRAVSA